NALYNNAVHNNNVAAQIWWSKARMRWQARSVRPCVHNQKLLFCCLHPRSSRVVSVLNSVHEVRVMGTCRLLSNLRNRLAIIGSRCARRFLRKHHVLLPVAIVALAGLFADGASSRPLRGSTQWVVLLCTYTDAPPIPAGRDPAYFQQMVLDRGTGGLADYWDAISIGERKLNASSMSC